MLIGGNNLCDVNSQFLPAHLHIFFHKKTKEEFDKFIFPLNEFSVESRPLS